MTLETTVDAVLGRVLRCPECTEEWPLDDEFYHMDGRGGLSTAWPRRCIACCQDYYAARRRLLMTIAKGERAVEVVPPEGKCGAYMFRQRHCGRRRDHRGGHRSVEAVEYDRVRQARKRMAA